MSIRSQFEKKVEEFNADIEDEPAALEQKIERNVISVEGELLRAKKKLDSLNDNVASARKRVAAIDHIVAIKRSVQGTYL